MKLGILSDLHMEFSNYTFEPQDDVYYILAGDINTQYNSQKRDQWLKDHKINFYIYGNHDYYGGSFPFNHDDEMKIEYQINIDYEEHPVENHIIAGATLWTDLLNPTDWHHYINGLNDFHYIDSLNSDVYNELHKIHKDFLRTSEADIIVTHHAPTYRSMHPRYVGSPENPAFYTNLEDMILHKMVRKPLIWIHGHTHSSHDYMLGDTRIICHPRGYSDEENFSNYQPKIIEI